MSRPPAGMLVVGLVGFICAIILLVYASNASHQQGVDTPKSNHSPVPQTTTEGVADRPRSSATPSSEAGSQAERTGEFPPHLKQRTRAFLKDVYLVKPDETSTGRRERLSPYLGPILAIGALTAIEGEIRKSEPSRQLRKKQSLAIEGIPSIRSAALHSDPKDKAVMVVRVPVTVVNIRPDGTSFDQRVSKSVSTWRLVDGDWYVIDFTLGGD